MILNMDGMRKKMRRDSAGEIARAVELIDKVIAGIRNTEEKQTNGRFAEAGVITAARRNVRRWTETLEKARDILSGLPPEREEPDGGDELRELLVQGMVRQHAMIQAFKSGEEPCRKAVSLLSVQLLLGDLRLGADCAQRKQELRRKLAKALAEPVGAAAVKPPDPGEWSLQQLRQAAAGLNAEADELLRRFSWRLLAERLLASLDGGEEDIVRALRASGIFPLDHADAPEKLRYRFTTGPDAGNYPGLFTRGADGVWECLAGGAHRTGTREDG